VGSALWISIRINLNPCFDQLWWKASLQVQKFLDWCSNDANYKNKSKQSLGGTFLYSSYISLLSSTKFLRRWVSIPKLFLHHFPTCSELSILHLHFPHCQPAESVILQGHHVILFDEPEAFPGSVCSKFCCNLISWRCMFLAFEDWMPKGE